ncbi:hydroxymethylglutaryl-CoA lyase [Desulfothermus naphthae]
MNYHLPLSEVFLTEVGPRDGLQSYPSFIPTSNKIKIIENLIEAGLKNIQITSFVNPKKVPQFKDAEEIVKYFRNTDLILTNLVLNKKGLERALSVGAKGVEISISASNDFNLKNTGMSKKDSIVSLKDMLLIAKKSGLYIRGSIQCCFGYVKSCDVSLEDVLEIVDIYLDVGVDEIVFADTTAKANPILISKFFENILKKVDSNIISMHFHSKMNLGIVNMYESLKFGIKRFDTSFGYLGGCPFLDKSYINISTEEAVNLLNELNIYTGVDLNKLKKCSNFLNNNEETGLMDCKTL